MFNLDTIELVVVNNLLPHISKALTKSKNCTALSPLATENDPETQNSDNL